MTNIPHVETGAESADGVKGRTLEVGKLVNGVISVLGVSGILYGIGFLALRSHYSMLGIWGGAPLSSTAIAEEGGRFLYHLIYIPINLLSSPGWATFVFLLLLGIFWDTKSWLAKRAIELFKYIGRAFRWLAARLPSPKFIKTFYKRLKARLPSLRRPWETLRGARTLGLGAALFITAVMLESVWVITGPAYVDVLRSRDARPAVLKTQDSRAHFYYDLYYRVLLGVLLGVYLYRALWCNADRLQRCLIVAQWLLVIGAVALFPVAYGKLMLPTTYRVISHPNEQSQSLLLIGQTSDAWVTWNCELKETEVLPNPDKEPVKLGAWVDLLQ
jgi:hypothetical protein